MVTKQICVLLLEDEAAHAEAIRRGLESAGNAFKLQIVGSLKKYREHVAANPPDIALVDMVLPDGNGIDLLTAPPEANAFPMLILTSHGNEAAAVAALKAGALDYIVKSPETFADMPRILTRLWNQWTLIQENKKTEQALKTSEQNFRNSMDNSPLGIRIVSENGETLYVNLAFLDIYGYKTIKEFKNTPVKDRYTPESYAEFHERREKRRRRQPLPDNYEVSIVRKDGKVRQLTVVRKEIVWGGKRQYQTIYEDITERKQAEEKVRQSEEKYSTLVEKSNDGIIIIENGIIQFINTKLETMTGFTTHEALGRKFIDFSPPEERELLMERHMKRMSGEKVTELYETKLVARDGHHIPVEINATNSVYQEHPVVLAFIRDITQRKRAEEAIRESERRYHDLFESTSDIIQSVSLDGHFVFVNRAWHEVLGYSESELSQLNLFKIVHPESLSHCQELFSRVIAGESVGNIQATFVAKDGRLVYVEGNATARSIGGKIVATHGFFRDITERKRAEEALKESEEKYRLIVENGNDVIFTFNAAGEFIYISPAIKKVLSYDPADLIGHPFWTLVHPEDMHGLQQAIQRNIKDSSQTPGGNECRVRDASGEWHWYNVSGNAVFDANGEFIYLVAIARDITEHKQMTMRINELNNILRLITDIDQLIVETDNEAELLQKACNQFVESRQYQMAWIGFTRDGSYDILPSAKAGQGLDYLSSVRITWDDSRFSQGPTGTAIKTGKLSVMKDMRHDPRFEPWREEALKRDFQSSVALPLIIQDKVIGALTIYSVSVDAFNENGLHLLSELAEDLSLGIEKIRLRQERLRMEEALRISEQNFRNSLDSSFIGINIVDTEFNTLYANQALLDIFGYGNIDELKASPPQEHYTPESHVSYVLRNERILRGELIPDKVEVDIVRKDGDMRHLQLFRKEVLWDGKQQYQILYNDITERKQAEDKLRENESRYSAIVENLPQKIFLRDINLAFIMCNENFAREFRLKPEEIIGKTDYDLHPKEMADKYTADDRRIIASGEMRDIEEPHILDGKEQIVRLVKAPVKDENGNVTGIAGMYWDITERKQMEETLRNNEKKLTTLFEIIPVGIFILDAEQKIVYMNQALERITDISKEGLFKGDYKNRKYLKADGTPLLAEELANARAINEQRPVYDVETCIVKEDGNVIWTSVSAVPVAFQDWKVVVITSDITERKKAEEERRRLEEKAQVASRLASVGEMAAGIAHEINNPLTGVLGFSQILLEKENIPEDIRENLKLIVDGSQRVADIVKRLLTFARQAKPVKTMANLNELIENTLKLRGYVLKTANIDVVTRFDPELPLSAVDPGQMQQVFLNLIVNAEQAMKETHGRGTLTITTEKKGNSIRMSFQDDGPGIAKENMGRMFQPFFTTKAPGEGTGLGLSLSRSIILEHGGTMNVESESGHGATFIIELPIVESLPFEADVATPPAKVKPAIMKKGKILVVDDEPGVRALLEKVLTQSGHAVDIIGDANKALDKLGAGITYDVILTDVRMPGMSGIELYSSIIKKMPEMQNRIIFITGDVMGADIKAFLMQNNLPYLAKPFDTKLLKEKIEVIMAGQPGNDNAGRSSK